MSSIVRAGALLSALLLVATACADSPMSPMSESREDVSRSVVMQAASPVLYTGGTELPSELTGLFTVQSATLNTTSAGNGNGNGGGNGGGNSGNLICVGGGMKVTPNSLPDVQRVADGAVTVTFHANKSVSFESALPINYLAVKGGNATNAYDFRGSLAGQGAFAPVNASGSPSAVSHVDFCFGSPVLNVSMSGAGDYDTEFAWSIEKTLGTAVAELDGLGVQQGWNVTVTKDAGTDKNFTLGASVVISNPTPWTATIVAIDAAAGSSAMLGTCSLPLTVAGNASVTCGTAETSLSEIVTTLAASVDMNNTAFTPTGAYNSVAFNDLSTTGSASWTQHKIHDNVTINDSMKGTLATVAASQHFNYTTTHTWSCGAGAIVKTNVATIVETGATASASATYSAPACVVALSDETAFAYDASNVRTFSALSNGAISRWGWSIAFGGAGSRSFDVYAAAGGNNIANGRKVGTVTIDYTGTTVTATYTMIAGYSVQSAHLYAGTNALPTTCSTNGKRAPVCTASVAPGQFTVSVNGGAINVIAHSVVRGDFSN